MNQIVSVILNLCYLIADVFTHYRCKFDRRLRPVHHLREQLESATSFQQYEDIAARLDYEKGNDVWRRNPQSRKYDHRVIAERISKLRNARLGDEVEVLAYLIRSGLLRNLANICDKQLFSRCYLGTKMLIQDYIAEVLTCLQTLRELPESGEKSMPLHAKIQLFKDTRHSYGLSALVLQGGASFGLFHIGVVKALWEQGLLPTVISGTAMGALIAAEVAISDDDELEMLLNEDTINLDAFQKRSTTGQTLRRFKRFLNEGYLLDISVLGELCRANIGDITFEEAFNKTNRVLNITIHATGVKSVPSLLNYLTAPNVLIWTAALASNSLPGLYEPVELLCKDQTGNVIPWAPYGGLKFRSAEVDTPFARLSELFNVNNFIVSQARPYLAPFLSSPLHRHSRRGFYLKCVNVIGLELSHRLKQLSAIGLVSQRAADYDLSTPATSEVTLVPSLEMRDFLKLLRNPTFEDIRYWSEKGQRATWPAISALRVRQLIEVQLGECYESLRHDELHPKEPVPFVQKRQRKRSMTVDNAVKFKK